MILLYYLNIDLESDIKHINDSKNALNTFLKTYDNHTYKQTIQDDITKENLKTLKAQKEYLALLYIQYYNESNQIFGNRFKQALKERTHYKLWYEIRYNSGSTKDKAIALKIFKQSNLFGLYENDKINNMISQSLNTQNTNQDIKSI